MDCGCSLEPPRQGESNVCRRSVFWAEMGIISQTNSTENFLIFHLLISSVYCMDMLS